jgi:hypothetical protein
MIVHWPTDPLFLGILRRGSQIAIGFRPNKVCRGMDAYQGSLIDAEQFPVIRQKFPVPAE